MIQKLHSIEVSEPLVSGNHIAFTTTMDADRKNMGRVVLPDLRISFFTRKLKLNVRIRLVVWKLNLQKLHIHLQ